MLQYLLDFRQATLEHNLGEVLLGMDNHTAQATPTFRATMDYLHIVPAYTPANCTDCVSPVDRHVGQALKTKIYAKYGEAYQNNHATWNKAARFGGITVADRRRLVTKWASEAWAEMCANSQKLIKSAFVSTGFLLAKDRSEDHLISLKYGKERGDDFETEYKY